MRRWVSRRRVTIGVVLAVALTVGVVAGVAAVTGVSTIYACYNPTTATLNKVGLGVPRPCGAGETLVSWAQSGSNDAVTNKPAATSGATSVDVAQTAVTVAQVNAPAGNYAVSSTIGWKSVADGEGTLSTDLVCELHTGSAAGPTVFSTRQSTEMDFDQYETLTFTTTVALPIATSIVEVCSAPLPGSDATIIGPIQLSALKVGTLTVQ